MEITEIKVKPVSDAGKMKALVSATFNDAFVVHDIKVIEGADKLFVAMPSRKTADNKFRDVAHPITSELRSYMGRMILDEYYKAIEKESFEA